MEKVTAHRWLKNIVNHIDLQYNQPFQNNLDVEMHMTDHMLGLKQIWLHSNDTYHSDYGERTALN